MPSLLFHFCYSSVKGVLRTVATNLSKYMKLEIWNIATTATMNSKLTQYSLWQPKIRIFNKLYANKRKINCSSGLPINIFKGFVFSGPQPFAWLPALAPDLYLPVLAPQSVFTSPGPQFVFNSPDSEFVFTGPDLKFVFTGPGL